MPAVACGKEGITITGPEIFGVMTTLATALRDGSATLAAITVAELFELTEGATKTPVLVIEPLVADQLTAILVVPWTKAAKVCLVPEARVTLKGVT